MTSSDRATPTRRGVLGGAAVAGAASVGLTASASAATGYRPAHHRGAPLLSAAGPAPREPVLVRRHAGAGEGGARCRRRPEVVREAALTGLRRGSRRVRPARLVGPRAVLRRQRRCRDAVGPPERGGRGRLGGHGQLRSLGAAATDPVAPPGPGDHGRVLGEPLQRPGQRRRRLHVADRPRDQAPLPGVDVVRDAAADRDHPPGDGDLPRQRREHEVGAQREPRP